MFELDIPRTELLVNSIIAATAVLGMIVSVSIVGRQLRHQNRLESKNIEKKQLHELLSVLDKPLDACAANAMDVDFLRATNPAALASAQALYQAQPALVVTFRVAFQHFTNVATTTTTIVPQCRRLRGINPATDVRYHSLETELTNLVTAYQQLGVKWANVNTLLRLGRAQWMNDPLQQNALSSVAAVRHYASALVASLYV